VWIQLKQPESSWLAHEVGGMFSKIVDKQAVNQIQWLIQRKMVNKMKWKLDKIGRAWRKNITNDYYMPNGVAATIGTFIDGLWYEVDMQIMNMVKGVMKIEEINKYEDCSVAAKRFVCCAKGVNKFTAMFRYVPRSSLLTGRSACRYRSCS